MNTAIVEAGSCFMNQYPVITMPDSDTPRRSVLPLRASGILLCLILMCGLAMAVNSLKDGSTAQTSEFQFIRLHYNNHPQFISSRNNWLTDTPGADLHFLGGVKRLTRIDTTDDSVGLPVMDDRLFDYPFIYAVEVGHWGLGDAEAQRLRDYLLRGGFLVVDDFHGTQEWAVFTESMQKVFPDRPIVELTDKDAVFHVLFDVDQRVQIPNVRGAMNGQTWEKDGYTPHWRGIFDDDGRLMVAINFNMDLGDAWEHADNPQYPEPLTRLAYHFGIDYILYSMTH